MIGQYSPYAYQQLVPQMSQGGQMQFAPQMVQAPQMQAPQMQTQQPQIQSGGFVVVHSEDEALRYPIVPGNSITFKIENQPIVIEKTMGFSQLESPKIERFRLIKEDAVVEPQREQASGGIEKLQGDYDSLRAELGRLKGEVARLRERLDGKSRRREASNEQ